MPYLGVALFAEGVTDHRFFAPLLVRLIEEIYYEAGRGTLELGDVIVLEAGEDERHLPRDEQIVAAARRNSGAFHILCVHADGGGNPRRVHDQQVSPGLTLALEVLGNGYAGVSLVPVREMEAWTIVDGDALRRAFRTTLQDDVLGVVPRPRDCEKVADPKAVLDRAYAQTLPGSKRGTNTTAAGVLQLIAESVRLDLLRQVPAFSAFRTDLKAALRRLGYLA
ncbi:MAG TPA: hypothetical protein VGC13_28455 [Longimicrobium sp.]|jgi:hypothetical protein|uniref:hypothetical protein n=1 Tax=Longimicrobium sp. TaxID=2029185 RepID=UPI002ED975F7